MEDPVVIEALSLSRNSVAFVTSSISVKETKNNINKKKKQKQKKNNNINKKKKKKKKNKLNLICSPQSPVSSIWPQG